MNVCERLLHLRESFYFCILKRGKKNNDFCFGYIHSNANLLKKIAKINQVFSLPMLPAKQYNLQFSNSHEYTT